MTLVHSSGGQGGIAAFPYPLPLAVSAPVCHLLNTSQSFVVCFLLLSRTLQLPYSCWIYLRLAAWGFVCCFLQPAQPALLDKDHRQASKVFGDALLS